MRWTSFGAHSPYRQVGLGRTMEVVFMGTDNLEVGFSYRVLFITGCWV